MATANFKFISDAAGGDQFTVVSFTGYEAISNLYRYEIEIKAPVTAEINLDDVLDAPARFVTEHDGDEYPVYGILASFDETRIRKGRIYYRAVLVPRLWSLSRYKTNEVFTEQQQTVDTIVNTVLSDAGLSDGTDYDLGGLDNSRFLRRDYICQFGESDFDFISRLLENEGIFYYFEHADGVEKIIFINDLNYDDIPGQKTVRFGDKGVEDRIHAWSCRKQRLPLEVRVRDHNPDNSSENISEITEIDSMGQGTEYFYGENLSIQDEAIYLSEVRAQERSCLKSRFNAKSNVVRLQAGYLFELDYPGSSYHGAGYLLTRIDRRGEHLDMAESSSSRSRRRSEPEYSNKLVAIPAEQQYRPRRATPRPRFYGTMTAFIHADPASNGIEINEKGYYLVNLPFDRSEIAASDTTDPERKVSAWIRMAQPSVGIDQGTYFPLKDGTEVLLTFINGDPDRPVITAALPNSIAASLLHADNDTQSIIQTTDSLVENIGISDDSTIPDFFNEQLSTWVVKGGEVKNVCPQPTRHVDANDKTKRGAYVDGHTLIQNEGSFAIHAQIQSVGSGQQWSHNTSFGPEDSSGKFGLPSTTKDPYFATSMFNTEDKYTNPGSPKYVDIFDNTKEINDQGSSVSRSAAELELGKVKFEILEDRVLLDTGGRDLSFKCNHYDVDNKSEINNTKGHDHTVHFGSAYEYFKGDSEEHYEGIKREYFHGKEFSETFENTTINSTFGKEGDTSKNCTAKEKFYGNKKSEHWGLSEDYWYGWPVGSGVKFEFNGGAVFGVDLGNVLEIKGGFHEEFFLAGQLSLGTGIMFDFNFSGGIEWAPFMFEMKSIQAKVEDVEMEKKLTAIKSSISEVKTTQGAAIEKTSAALFKCGAELGSVDIRVAAGNLLIHA